jgi:6-phosphofructokinase 1
VTGEVHEIAARRAERQRITVAGGPDLSIKPLGQARIESPLAGPRRKIFFDPSKTRAGIVTCGGLCPGLNDVIRSLVRNLTYHYGVPASRRLPGAARYQHPFRGRRRRHHARCDADRERGRRTWSADRRGRGAQDDRQRHSYLDQSFGFQTAFARAIESIHAVTVEAKSTPYGVGLVKLMSRHSGFIACYAALARNDADVVLIPEVAFQLDGAGGLLHHVQRRVRERGYAVVVVAEGAGQELLDGDEAASAPTFRAYPDGAGRQQAQPGGPAR